MKSETEVKELRRNLNKQVLAIIETYKSSPENLPVEKIFERRNQIKILDWVLE